MKIISKHKDYYDNALSYGVDTTQVYVRNEKFIDVKAPRDFDEYPSSDGSLDIKNSHQTQIEITEYPIVLGFCGKFYIGCRICVKQNSEFIEEDIFYSKSQIHNYLTKLTSRFKIEFEFRYAPEPKASVDMVVERIMNNFKRLSEQFNSKVFENWFYEFDTPVLMYPSKHYSPVKYHKHYGEDYYNYHGQLEIVLNPVLKDLGFYRVKESFDCYQEISQFKFGVLANNYSPSSPRTDKEKIDSHGFDRKYGFRTRPKGKE